MVAVDGERSDTRALFAALATLREGRFNDGSMEGAKTAAYEAMAWSLVGLLAHELRDQEPPLLDPPAPGRFRITDLPAPS